MSRVVFDAEKGSQFLQTSEHFLKNLRISDKRTPYYIRNILDQSLKHLFFWEFNLKKKKERKKKRKKGFSGKIQN